MVLSSREKTWLVVAMLALFVGAISLTYSLAQPAGQGPITANVQWSPPGSPGSGQTAWNARAGGTTGSVVATQAAVAGKTHYVTGFEVTGTGATAGTTSTVTLASGGTTVGLYVMNVPAGPTTAAQPLVIEYPVPIQMNGPNQNVQLTVSAFGAGTVQVNCMVHGFYQ